MTIQLKFAAASDIGLVRKNNQDSGYASQTLFAVADGMGGAAAGDLASAVAISHLATVDGNHAPDALLSCLRNALNDAHEELILRTEENPQLAGMGTTCVAVLRSGNKLAMAHIGDSRAYLLRDKTLTQITHDHTLVQYLVDTGQITQEEAKTHPKRNVIMRALSDDPEEKEIAIDESIREAVPGDRWLLCSDGLYGPVSLETIYDTLSTVKNLEKCAQALIGHALAGGAPDNVTVVLVDVVEMADESIEIPPEFKQAQIVGAAINREIKIFNTDELAAAKKVRLTNSKNENLEQSGQANRNLTLNPAEMLALSVEEKSNIENFSESASASAFKFDEHSKYSAKASEKNGKKRRSGIKILAFFGILLALTGGIFGAYQWSQTKFYVAPADGYIGIYQGVPTEIGSLKLSHLKERSEVRISDLSDFVQARLKTPITRDSLESAREVVNSLAVHKKVATNND